MTVTATANECAATWKRRIRERERERVDRTRECWKEDREGVVRERDKANAPKRTDCVVMFEHQAPYSLLGTALPTSFCPALILFHRSCLPVTPSLSVNPSSFKLLVLSSLLLSFTVPGTLYFKGTSLLQALLLLSILY